MHRGGVAQRTHQRHRRALRQRYIGIPEMQQLQRVTGRLLHLSLIHIFGFGGLLSNIPEAGLALTALESLLAHHLSLIHI